MIFYLLLVAVSTCLAAYIAYKLFTREIKDCVIDGNFYVNGKGKVGIDLYQKDIPKSVEVCFVDDFHSHPCHPCNPHHDKLSWELVEICGIIQLIINFDVGNVREIFYKVIY